MQPNAGAGYGANMDAMKTLPALVYIVALAVCAVVAISMLGQQARMRLVMRLGL